MSRKGNKLIAINNGTKLTINNDHVIVSNNKGFLTVNYPSDLIKVEQIDNNIKVSRLNDETKARVFHGTVNSLIANAVKGIQDGFTKTLNIVGVGYKAAVKGKKLEVHAGYSGTGPRLLDIPEGLIVTCPTPTQIIISGANKQLVGQFTSLVRDIRRPEPYNGKGIMYSDEIIVRKVGKKAEGAAKK